MLRFSTQKQLGLSLVETCVIIALVGSIAAIFIPTFFLNLNTDRFREAPSQLASIEKSLKAYYYQKHGNMRHCVPHLPFVDAEIDEADKPNPAQKIAPADIWETLELSTDKPPRFEYSVEVDIKGCTITPTDAEHDESPRHGKIRARADFDGDGRYSSFEKHFTVKGAAFEIKPMLYVVDRVE